MMMSSNRCKSIVDFYFMLLQKELSIRKYSKGTIKSYMRINRDFLLFSGKKLEKIEDEDVKRCLYYIVNQKKIATSTLNIIINALRFYYGKVLKKNFIFEVKHPKKDKKLPVALSREEVKRILNVTANIKHKTILMLIYSGGLRVGEVVKLKPEDIDSNRKLIHIKTSKGRKDPYTLLSDAALQILREYRKKERSERWLFPSRNKEKHMTERTVQKIFQNANKKAGAKKKVTVNSLGHNFAPHLLESGTDSIYIQKLLDHKSSKATKFYTHVNTKNISAINNQVGSFLAGGED